MGAAEPATLALNSLFSRRATTDITLRTPTRMRIHSTVREVP